MNLLYVVLIVAALVGVFAAHHFHLIATIKELFPNHAAAPSAASVNVTTTGDVTVHTGNSMPPAPPAPVVPTPDHGATPPANAGATGTHNGAVPGGDTPDANGAIAIPSIAAKFAPGSRFLTVASLPYVPKASAQAFCIAANCQNVKFLEGAFVNIPDFSNYKPLAAVANPPSAAAVGGAAFHLQGQFPGEARTFLTGCIAISNDLTTMDEVVEYCAKLPDYGSTHQILPVAGPGGGDHGQFK